MPLQNLPESVRRLLEQQGAGFYQTPNQQSSSRDVTAQLQAAAGRRFGQSGEFDPEYDAGIRSLLGQVPDLEARFQNQRGRVDEDFTQGAEKLDREKGLDDERHINTMADRGLGFSGANLVGQGRIAEGFQRNVQGLTTNRSRQLADLTGQQNAAYRSLTDRASEAQGSAANRATVRDQQRAWQAEQVRMEQERAAAQQRFAEEQMRMQQAAQAEAQAAQRRMEEMLRQQSQPQPAPTGAYRPPPPPPPPPPPGPSMQDILNAAFEDTRIRNRNYDDGGRYIGAM